MGESKPPIYKKHKDKNIQHTKSLDKLNRTIHEYNIHTVTNYHFRISEPTIRKIYLIFGFVFGIIIHIFYIQNYSLLSKYVKNIKIFLFNITPFARSILKNANFRYVFYISTVLTLLISIIFFRIIWSDYKKVILSLIVTLIFSFAYLYLNFAVCHLIIKIPIYFKILATLTIIISNIIIGIVCCAIGLFISAFILEKIK